MEMAGQGTNYRQLADEIGSVLQAAAETAEKMQDEARLEAARIRAEGEAERRTAYAEGRRILEEARMEADMVRAEAEWQAQEIIAQARRHAAERIAGADTRLADLNQVEHRVMERLAGVGQVLTEALAMLREGTASDQAVAASPPPAPDALPEVPPFDPEDETEAPTAKVYFVEFPPAAPADPGPATVPAPAPVEPAAPAPAPALGYPDPEAEIILTDAAGPSLFPTEDERSEWAPPPDLPVWWTQNGAQA